MVSMTERVGISPGWIVYARYEIISEIARRDYEIWYTAYDPHGRHNIVLRECFPAQATRRFGEKRLENFLPSVKQDVARFLDRGRALLNLAPHVHSAVVLDCFRESGTAYLVTEAVDGPLLADVVGAGLNETEVANIIGPLIDVLRVLHREGLVHGEMMPDNVALVEGRGPILLGLKGARAGDPSMIESITPYVAPELLTTSAPLTANADLYSLAAIAYKALTGIDVPVGYERFDSADATLSIPFGMPEMLSTAIACALSIDGDARGTVDDLAAVFAADAQPGKFHFEGLTKASRSAAAIQPQQLIAAQTSPQVPPIPQIPQVRTIPGIPAIPGITRRGLLIGLGAGTTALGAGWLASRARIISTQRETVPAPPAGPTITKPVVAPTLDIANPVTFGSFYSGDIESRAIRAALNTSPVKTEIKTFPVDSYLENFATYVQQPDDVMCSFGGHTVRKLAASGAISDVSDVWTGLSSIPEAFKDASTGWDEKQYIVPFSCFVWAIHYRKSLWNEKGYTIPNNWDELLALCARIKEDGITPFAAGNMRYWLQMGMFEIINMRTNGYDFHISLLSGRERWTDPRVLTTFDRWRELLPYYEADVNTRTWQQATQSLAQNTAAMYLVGTFIDFELEKEPSGKDVVNDVDIFAFPSIDPRFGQDCIQAPTEGFLLSASPRNRAGATALLAQLGTTAAIDAFLATEKDPLFRSIPVADDADQSRFTARQRRCVELLRPVKHVSQGIDRDTDEGFAMKTFGPALADFVAGQEISSLLTRVEAASRAVKW